MTATDLRPSRLPWPPVVYLAAVGLATLLTFLVPLPWLGSPASDLLFAIGIVIAAGVVALYVTALRAFRKARTTVRPDRAAEHLVTSGPYAFTRNPMYLGNTVLMLAIGLVAGALWFLPLALVAAFATQKLAIEPEERHLQARFGKRYRDYAKKIRRWI